MESKAFEQHFQEFAAERWPDDNERARMAWVLAGIRAHMRWGQGKEVSRAELDAAADEVMGLKLGDAAPPKQAPTR